MSNNRVRDDIKYALGEAKHRAKLWVISISISLVVFGIPLFVFDWASEYASGRHYSRSEQAVVDNAISARARLEGIAFDKCMKESLALGRLGTDAQHDFYNKCTLDYTKSELSLTDFIKNEHDSSVASQIKRSR